MLIYVHIYYNVDESFVSHLWYTCNTRTIMYACVGGFLGVLLILGLITSVLYYRHRLKQNRVNYLLVDNAVEMEYDAFISYDEDNLDLNRFVKAMLYPDMVRREIKICCRAVDIRPGMPELPGIANLLEKGRKTLALLTNDYVQNYCCMREFNTSLDLGINRGQEMLIPVWMEDPDPNLENNGVVRYVRVNGSVQYSEDMCERAFMEYIAFQILK
jgi:hypothetical protein